MKETRQLSQAEIPECSEACCTIAKTLLNICKCTLKMYHNPKPHQTLLVKTIQVSTTKTIQTWKTTVLLEDGEKCNDNLLSDEIDKK